MHLDAAEFGELGGDEIGGALLLEAELGMRMDVAPDGGQLVVEPGNGIENRHRIPRHAADNPLPLSPTLGEGRSACARVWESWLVLALVDQRVLLDPRHHRAQPLADLLDLVLLRRRGASP